MPGVGYFSIELLALEVPEAPQRRLDIATAGGKNEGIQCPGQGREDSHTP